MIQIMVVEPRLADVIVSSFESFTWFCCNKTSRQLLELNKGEAPQTQKRENHLYVVNWLFN